VKLLAHSFLEATTGAESWPSALSRMADSFGAIESHFTVWDRAHGRILFSARAGRFPADANEQYARYFHRVDTCKEALLFSQPGEVMLTQTYYGESFVNTEIYNDFLRPLGARHVMGVKLADFGPAVSMLRIHRSGRNGPYSEEDVRKLTTLFPSLSRSAQVYLNQLQVTRTAKVATAALDHLRVGVIVIDRRRRIVHLNSPAERILTNDTIMTLRSGRLGFADGNVDVAVRRLVDAAFSPLGLSSSDRTWSARAGQYEVSISPLADDDALAGVEAVLVTLDSDGRTSQNLIEKLRVEFGLTSREAAIAEQIANGRTLHQIAAQNAVSLNTVKTHLKAVFGKMDVHSQSDLVRLTLGLRSKGL
jgi:DNA-binding CsgD family transcriptional regulator